MVEYRLSRTTKRRRGHAKLAFELVGKMRGTAKAHRQGNLQYAGVGFPQLPLGFLKASAGEVMIGGFRSLFREKLQS